jgi:hypothetical protein
MVTVPFVVILLIMLLLNGDSLPSKKITFIFSHWLRRQRILAAVVVSVVDCVVAVSQDQDYLNFARYLSIVILQSSKRRLETDW